MIIAEIANQTTHTVTQTGIGLGSAMAIVCSWQRNRSILWAMRARGDETDLVRSFGLLADARVFDAACRALHKC